MGYGKEVSDGRLSKHQGPAARLPPNSLVYFETSAWNRLADRLDRDALIARIKELGIRVVTCTPPASC